MAAPARRAVAAYVAKYATKAAEDFGAGDRPIDPQGARTRGTNPHAVRMIDTCYRLADAVEELAGMRRWTHMLGFRGHFSTKSRKYSTTLGALRGARVEHHRRQDPDFAHARQAGDEQDDEDTTLIVGEWHFAGVGHTTTGDAVLAAGAAARAGSGESLPAKQRPDDNRPTKGAAMSTTTPGSRKTRAIPSAAGATRPLPDQLMDIEAMADRLGVGVRHVRRLVQERRIPYLKWGHYVRFDPADVAAWLERSRVTDW